MQRPRILHIFSRYGEVGGEEICFHAITEALGAIADVTPFVYSTEELFHSPHGALKKMGYLLHNRDVEQKLRECLRENRYDAWIIHNTFPAMSPCVYELALHQPAPVIHYMHNYRSGCLNGVFYRDGVPCFSCQGGNYFPGIMHAWLVEKRRVLIPAAAVLYKTRRMEPGAAFPPTLPSAGASGNFSSKPEYRRIKSGLFHISSGKTPPLPPARPAGTSFTPDA